MKPAFTRVEIYDFCPPGTFSKREELLALGKSKLDRALIYLRELFIASHENRSARKYLNSHAQINNEKLRQLQYHTYMIHPFSLFRYCWDVFMVMVMSAGLILVPYQAAFDMTRSTFESWAILKSTLIACCCCDVIINFLTGYLDKAEGSVELRSRLIATHYAKNRFVFDLAGSIPTDVFFEIGWNRHIVAREMASLIFIFRSVSAMSYSDRLSRYYGLRRSFSDFFSAIYWIGTIIHWQACLHWITPVAVASMTSPRRPNEDSWINSKSLWENPSDISKYKHCLLRSIATTMRSGFPSEMRPQTVEDQLLVSLTLFLSLLMFFWLLTGATHLFVSVNSSRLKYNAAISHLHQYMERKQLPRRTRRRVEEFYEYVFQGRFFKHGEIVDTLSANVYQEQRLHSCRKLVENVIFLNDLPRSFIARLVTLLVSETYLTNDVIVEADQPGDCMYFVASGTVAVYTSTGREICHLEDGAHFGEISIIVPEAKRVASVVAVEPSKLYKLRRADFARTVHPYPVLYERIRRNAIEWYEDRTGMSVKR